VNWQVTPYTFAASAACVVVLGLGVLGWRRRPVPGATEFAWFAAAVGDWCLAAGIGFARTDLAGKMLATRFEYLGVVSAPVLWLLCMAACTGAGRRPRWQLAALAVIPLITLGLVFTNELHGLIWRDVEIDRVNGLSLWKATYGPWFWVHSAYCYLALAGATWLILRQTRRDPFFFLSQGALLLIGMSIPWATNAVYLSGLSPFPNLDLTPLGFALGAAAVGASLLRFGLFDVVPIAREALVEGLPDAVIVLDMRDRVVTLNPAAERLLGQASRTLLGRPATDISGINALLASGTGEISEADIRASRSQGTAEHQAGPAPGTAERQASPAPSTADHQASPPPGTAERQTSPPLGAAGRQASRAPGTAKHQASPAPGVMDRCFDVGRVALADRRGRPVGRLLVVRDITERVRAMRVELERAAAQEAAVRTSRLYEEQQRIVSRLRELRGLLEAAERRKLLDAERERIARELHDRVEQTFFSIGLSVSALLASLANVPGSPTESLWAALAGIRSSAQQGAEDLRAAIFALTRAEVHDLELVQALWQLVREFQQRTGLEADLAESGTERRAPPEIAEVLHAVAREGLANVERHARASAVVVSLAFEPEAVTLTVQDDGVGASPLVLSTLADSATRFGLNGSRDRVLRLGGTFTAQAGDDEGFVLRARVPLSGHA